MPKAAEGGRIVMSAESPVEEMPWRCKVSTTLKCHVFPIRAYVEQPSGPRALLAWTEMGVPLRTVVSVATGPVPSAGKR